jgi:hypothetical protein
MDIQQQEAKPIFGDKRNAQTPTTPRGTRKPAADTKSAEDWH